MSNPDASANPDGPDAPARASCSWLLGAGDPPPVEIVNPQGRRPLVLLCDHAGRAIPKRLGTLGLSPKDLDRHIAYDIGAEAMTSLLAERLDAPAVLARYSRLVIDCNRAPGNPQSIIAASDGTTVAANRNVSDTEAEARIEEIFWPYHRAASTTITRQWRRLGIPPGVFSVHSFTPRFNGQDRPWDAGVLWHRDPRIAAPLLDFLSRIDGLTIGDNLPYSGLLTAYTTDLHGGAAGLPNCAIEVRQDLVTDPAGIATWAERLGDALEKVFAAETIHRVQRF